MTYPLIADPLTYTLDTIVEIERAVFERKVDTPDQFGAEEVITWETYIEPVPCKFWWWHGESGRSTAREYAEAERKVNLRGGGMLVALGTDVTTKDRLQRVENWRGETLVDTGPFRIVAVEQLPGHLELALYQP